MRVKLTASCIIMALGSGCGQEPNGNQLDGAADISIEEQAEVYARPSLGIDEVDAERLIAAAGKPWAGEPEVLESADGYVDGRQKTLIYESGTAMIYILPDGNVWQMKLMAGKGTQCGDIDNASSIVSSMATAISPTQSPEETAKLAEQVAQHLKTGNGYKDFVIAGVKWKPINDCLQTLFINVDSF